MSKRRRSPARVGGWFPTLAIVVAAWATSPALAQIPDEFTNLQFFPEDISREELIGNMRQFSFALDVRCQYCHSGGDGISFEGVEFDSDDKPEKRRARYMLEMTSAINKTLLAGLPERRTPNVGVECRTCHRGLARPQMIDDLLRERIASDGVESATDDYRALREENYGGWSYDFGEWVINDLAGEYRDEDPEITAAVLRMNSEFHPESVSVWVGLANAEEEAGDRDAAIQAARKAQGLTPDSPQVRRLLQSLGVDPDGSVER